MTLNIYELVYDIQLPSARDFALGGEAQWYPEGGQAEAKFGLANRRVWRPETDTVRWQHMLHIQIASIISLFHAFLPKESISYPFIYDFYEISCLFEVIYNTFLFLDSLHGIIHLCWPEKIGGFRFLL